MAYIDLSMYFIDLMNVKNADFISKNVEKGDYYYPNLTPQNPANDTVICGGRERCAPDYRINRNGFKFCSIEFVSAGKGTLVLRQNEYPLRTGSLFFYGPSIPHTIITDPDTPMTKHFVDFSGSGLLALVKETALFLSPLYTARPFRMRSLFESLLQAGGEEGRHRDELCNLILRQIILTVDSTSLPHQEVCSPAWQTYLRCRHRIEQRFESLNNLAQVASQCHIDKAYLCRLFKRYANETPLQMLNRLKMARAAELLATGRLLVKEAAEACGYADPYHFSRVFKRVYGIPPELFSRAARRTK